MLYELLTGEFLAGKEDTTNIAKCIYPEKKWDKVDHRFKSYIEIFAKTRIFSPKQRICASEMVSMIQEV